MLGPFAAERHIAGAPIGAIAFEQFALKVEEWLMSVRRHAGVRRVALILAQVAARLANVRRAENKRRMAQEGLFVEEGLMARLRAMA